MNFQDPYYQEQIKRQTCGASPQLLPCERCAEEADLQEACEKLLIKQGFRLEFHGHKLLFNRHKAIFSGLKMEMVGCRSTTFGTVVK